MKKISVLLFSVCILLNLFLQPQNGVKAENNLQAIRIFVDGEEVELDVPPVIVNGRTLVPLRGVFEKLGATVDWNKETNQVIVKNNSVEILLEPDNFAVLLNGQVKFLDTASRIQEDRTLIPIRFIAESLGYKVTWEDESRRIDISTDSSIVPVKETALPTLGSSAALTQLLHYNNVLYSYLYQRNSGLMVKGTVGIALPTATPTAAKATDSATNAVEAGTVAGDYTGTNNQTQGVDEGDILKTNGKSIFSLNQNNIYIIDPNPVSPKILSTIEVPTQRGSISDIYVENNRLAVIGTGNVLYGYPKDLLKPFGAEMMPTYSTNNTFVLVYDITDPTKPVLSKDMDFEGNYTSSRLIDDKLYVISNKAIYYRTVPPIYATDTAVKATVSSVAAVDSKNANLPILNDVEYNADTEALQEYQIKPKYADNITGQVTVIDYNKIQYFPDYITPNIMMTAGIDLSGTAVDVKSYLGSADTVYASADNLYLAFTKYEYVTKYNALLYVPDYKKTTTVYRFKLENGQINYSASGSVPGSILNQFSLDEYNGTLRIATTTGEMWDANNLSKNNVYLLNSDLKKIGELTDLAPGERIYSTRFAENRIYMVTFRQVDPFFVIDTTNPTTPKVLGTLKIPGFSTYMHILDENHVLGFGSDTVEKDGRVTTGGFKISLFDVTDPTNPIEQSKEIIGVAGTYSELQNNHKALMISLNKGIMAFPITVSGKTPYVQDFSGAYVYHITTNSFEFKGTVTHKPEQSQVNNMYGYSISRLLSIGNYLYSFSNEKMVVTNLDNLSKTSDLTFPVVKTVSKIVPYSEPIPAVKE